MPSPRRSVCLLLSALLLASTAPALASSPHTTTTDSQPAGPALEWEKLDPPTSPPETLRVSAPMVYNASRQEIVLYGMESFPNRSSTWTWNGETWTKLDIESPSFRGRAAMTYDEARQQVVLFGGDLGGAGNPTNETWVFRDGSWTLLEPAASPSPRYGASLGYDPISQTVIMFGGCCYLADTWSFDGTTWTNRTKSGGPDARYSAEMTYDESRGRLVMFGGIGFRAGKSSPDRGARRLADSFLQQDTWSWDGRRWERQQLDRRPGGRTASAMTTVAGRPTLVGGSSPAGRLREVWTLGETGWRRSGDLVPRGSAGMAFAWDAAREKAIYFGGELRRGRWSNETWSVTR